MNVQIRVWPADELLSLEDWLNHEPELRARVKAVGPTPSVGELGTAYNLLSIAIGAGGLLSVLAASLRTWLAQPRRSDVRIMVRTADGRVVEIEAKRIDDIESILRQALPPGDRE